jgi:multiple sugar transport system ATP-binding protein
MFSVAGVRFEGVWKLFGDDVAAVRDLNLEIQDGEFLVLVGPSGCGKTTSLRMLGGLETPSYGRIWMGDTDVTLMSPGRRDVAMVFQSYALYPHMTVYKNLSFGPSVRHEPKEKTKKRIEEVAEVLGISGLLDRRPNELSGGQRQRVALGRSLIREPQLFLLDEPLSNLDAALRVQMRTELVRLHRLLPVTTVYVTHDQVEALTMGDRVAVFNLGELLQVGTPDQLYNSPSNVFVAEFIGSPKINLFPGELKEAKADGITIRCLEQTVTLRGRSLSGGSASSASKLVAGVRPHDLHWSGEAPERCHVRVAVTVEVIEHTGSEMFVEAATAEGVRLKARLHRSATVEVGDETEFALDPRDVHLFGEETGEALIDHSSGPIASPIPRETQERQPTSVGASSVAPKMEDGVR